VFWFRVDVQGKVFLEGALRWLSELDGDKDVAGLGELEESKKIGSDGWSKSIVLSSFGDGSWQPTVLVRFCIVCMCFQFRKRKEEVRWVTQTCLQLDL
jgi:hypothetical protein